MTLPQALREIVDDFAAVDERDRVTLLADLADALPDLPERYVEQPELLERVAECQSPVGVRVEVDGDAVHVHASAPAGAPTTRGFAAILALGLEGASPQAVLAVPANLPTMLGLERSVSLLRLRGMAGMLGRIQRQTRERLDD